jgi:tetratricopeptide (TPR) repeat protein
LISMGSTWRRWIVALLILGVTTPAWAYEREVVRSFSRRLTNLQGAISRMVDLYSSPLTILAKHDVQSRLIDARVFFDLGQFENAGVLLMELVHTRSFKTSPDYTAAALMLGRCLVEMGNRKGAATYLSKVVASPDLRFSDEASHLLLSMVLDTASDEDVREQVDRARPPRSEKTRYVLGKAKLRLGDFQASLSILSAIGGQSPYFSRATYYRATALVALGRHPEAIGLFQSLVGQAGTGEHEARVRDLARLALGRLTLEQGDIVTAVTHYQMISRNSLSYEVALYEMAWAHIESEQYDKALNTIDSLLLTVKDPQLDVEAHTLRGRLNIFLDDHDSAVDTFEKIINRFAPIRNELDKFTRDPKNIQRYFQWLIERRGEGGNLNAPMTPRTATWVESTGEMKRMVEIFEELGDQNRELLTAQDMAQMLETVVASRSRVELFPELKDGWAQALIVENQLLALTSQMLEYQYQEKRESLSGPERAKLDRLRTWRRTLENRFKKLPMTFEQYQERKDRVDEGFLDLQRQTFLVSQRLKELEKELVAVEQYINEKQFGMGGDRYSEDQEQEFRLLIADEKDRIMGIQDSLDDLREELEVESRRVGAGGDANEGDGHLKQGLIAAYKREGLIYDALSETASGEPGRLGREMTRHRSVVWDTVARINEIVGSIDGRVAAAAIKLRAKIRKEATRLSRYSGELAAYEAEGREIGREIGERLFEESRDNMKALVRGADVGLIDVVWQQKRSETNAVNKLNIERSDRVSALDASLSELTADRIRGDGEKEEEEGDE